jgi:hypothetical protein
MRRYFALISAYVLDDDQELPDLGISLHAVCTSHRRAREIAAMQDLETTWSILEFGEDELDKELS